MSKKTPRKRGPKSRLGPISGSPFKAHLSLGHITPLLPINSSSSESLGHHKCPEIKPFAFLQTMRYVERNLIYVVGIPADAMQLPLASPHYFGRFGTIEKIQFGTSTHKGGNSDVDTVGAHILFKHEHNALLCLFCTNGSYFDGSPLKASRGTTKYCTHFLNNRRCPNPGCTYKHDAGRKQDRFSEEEMTADNPRFLNLTRPCPPPKIQFILCDFYRDPPPSQPNFPDPIYDGDKMTFPGLTPDDEDDDEDEYVDFDDDDEDDDDLPSSSDSSQSTSPRSIDCFDFNPQPKRIDASAPAARWEEEDDEEEVDDEDIAKEKDKYCDRKNLQNQELRNEPPPPPLVPDNDIAVPIDKYASLFPGALLSEEEIYESWKKIREEGHREYRKMCQKEIDEEQQTVCPNPVSGWPIQWYWK